MRCPVWLSALVAILGISHAAPYYGTKIGKFKTYHHDVVGEVYAVDDKHIFIKGFTYDGAGPDAFFWAGSTSRPDATGFIIPDENGASMPLKAYRNKDILLKLPGKKTLRDIRWLAVWCRKFQANFGDLIIPRNLQIPRATDIGKLSSLQHGVSSGNVMVLDSRTFLVPDFTYDGQGPGKRQNLARSPHPTRVPPGNARRRTNVQLSNTARTPTRPPNHYANHRNFESVRTPHRNT